MTKMITYASATEDQYTEFLNLMLEHMAGYLAATLEMMEMSIAEFSHLVKTVGKVYSINLNQAVAGYYWIESRGAELHLHGIIVKPAYQGEGLGTRTLKMIETEYGDDKDFIELGVHQDNENARKLYEKLGYQEITTKTEMGFHIMRKTLS